MTYQIFFSLIYLLFFIINSFIIVNTSPLSQSSLENLEKAKEILSKNVLIDGYKLYLKKFIKFFDYF